MADIFEYKFPPASLQIEAILRERLQSMKVGVKLGDAYGATIDRIKAQGVEKAELAMATLTWVCYSERP